MTAAKQRQAVLDDLVAYWGPEARSPEELIIVNGTRRHGPPELHQLRDIWRVDHLWPAMAAIPRPGALGRDGSLSRWPGYFEGAIEAGIQAAVGLLQWSVSALKALRKFYQLQNLEPNQ